MAARRPLDKQIITAYAGNHTLDQTVLRLCVRIALLLVTMVVNVLMDTHANVHTAMVELTVLEVSNIQQF